MDKLNNQKEKEENKAIEVNKDSFYFKYVLNENLLSEEEYNDNIKISIKVSKKTNLDAKQLLILHPITKFYSKKRNLFILFNILNRKSIISLRLIEYFVVNYVLKEKLYYNIKKYENDDNYLINNLYSLKLKKDVKVNDNDITYENIFIVHDNYKSQLKQYSKKNFDPFCRSKHIRLFYDLDKGTNYSFETTVAQLNFFKWAISNYILDYIIDNLEKIENSMSNYEKNMKQRTNKKKIQLGITNQNNKTVKSKLENNNIDKYDLNMKNIDISSISNEKLNENKNKLNELINDNDDVLSVNNIISDKTNIKNKTHTCVFKEKKTHAKLNRATYTMKAKNIIIFD